jgi:hypothetical protein
MRVSHLLLVTAFASVFPILACSDSTSATPVGKVSVQVVDANNAGVHLVNVDLYKAVSGGVVLWRASRTSSDGIAIFGESGGGIGAGEYYVHVSFITNYQLAPGETNDKPVTVQGGDSVGVTFHVVTVGPGI